MGYVKQHTGAIRRPWSRLGATSALVGRSMIYGEDRVPANNLRRGVDPIVMPPRPMPPIWRGGLSPAWGGNRPSWGDNPNNPSTQNNLAQLTLQYQSNPASLTASQWQQLQAAGVIPGTVPYSSAGMVNPLASSGSTTVDPGATQPAPVASTSSFLGTDASGNTTIFGLPWYIVGGGAALVFYMMSGKRGR